MAIAAVLFIPAVATIFGHPCQAGQKTKDEAQTVQPRDKWALIVGVDRFADPKIQSTRFAGGAATNLHAVLKDPGVGRFVPDHAIKLIDASATRETIIKWLTTDGISQKALPADLIVVLFAGKIVPSTDHSDAIFVPFDGDSKQLASTGVPLKATLVDLHSRTQCKNIICILDTNPDKDETATDLPKVSHIAEDCRVTVLSANELFQPSVLSTFGDGSSFSHYLTDGIHTGGGLMSLTAIAEYVQQNVRTDAKNAGKTQTVQFFANPENKPIAQLALGCAPKIVPPKTFNLGHPLDTLALKRPDLARPRGMVQQPAPSTDESDEDEAESKFGAPDFGPYISKMKKSIESKWKPPKGFEDRKVVAVFSIMRDGKIVEPTIVQSSGIDDVDIAAMEALHAASPLDPLPQGAPRSVQMRYQFDWHVNHQ